MAGEIGGAHSADVQLLRVRVGAATVLTALAAVVAVVVPRPAVAATVLDPSYGVGGVATLPLGPQDNAYVMSATVDSSGRAVAVIMHRAVVRFTADGLPDESFGTHGSVTLPAGFGPWRVSASGGEVALSGSYSPSSGTGPSGPAVLLLHDDGTPDPRLGVNGLLVISSQDGLEYATSVNLRADGALTFSVSAPTEADAPYRIYRYRPDGTPDPAFGNQGVVTMAGRTGWADMAFTPVATDPSGRVSYVEEREAVPATETTPFTTRVIRLLPNGALDTTFGTNGATTIPGGVFGFTVDTHDAATYLAGRSTIGQAAAVWKLRADGHMDPTFGVGGQANASPTGRTSPGLFGIALLPSGRIAVQGQATIPLTAPATNTIMLSVLRPDGSLETSFGDRGALTVDRGFTWDAIGAGTNGRVLLITEPAGTSGSGDIVRAYTTDFPTLSPAITAVTPRPGALSVTWTPPAINTTNPVRAYYVAALDAGTVAGGTVVAADVRQVSISGLTNGRAYQVVVVPYTGTGPGITSAAVTATPASAAPAVTPAGAVQNLAVSAGNAFATVTWSPPGDDGGAPISVYSVIAINHSTGALAAWRNLPADMRTAAIPALTNSTSYDLYVLAATSVGFGQVAPAVHTTPLSTETAALPPTIPWTSVVAVGSNAVVTWGPPTEHGQTATHVNVIAIQNGTMTAWSVTAPDQRHTTIPLAATGTAQIYVVAQSATGYGPIGTPTAIQP